VERVTGIELALSAWELSIPARPGDVTRPNTCQERSVTAAGGLPSGHALARFPALCRQ